MAVITRLTLDSINYWVSTEYVQYNNFSWQYEALVGGYDRLIWKTPTPHGGFADLAFGSITISPDFFKKKASFWPPPETIPILIEMTYDFITNSHLLVGTLYISGITSSGVTYDFYSQTQNILWLDTATDYNGDDVPLPLAIGTIQHEEPVKLPDDAGDPTYHHGWLSGTGGTDWHVFDDGVNIDANLTKVTASQFSLTASPTGEVTISGTGVEASLEDVFDRAGTRLSLTTNKSNIRSTAITLNMWADEQMECTAFLGMACEYTSHVSYIWNSILYIVDLEKDVSEKEIEQFEFKESYMEYEAQTYMLKSNWIVRNAVTTPGNMIKETSDSTYVYSDFDKGSTQSITCFDTDKATIQGHLGTALSKLNAMHCIIKGPIETMLDGVVAILGRKYSWVNTTFLYNTECWLKATEVNFDLSNEMVTIRGYGSASNWYGEIIGQPEEPDETPVTPYTATALRWFRNGKTGIRRWF